jgi:hypothetical protein
LATAGDLSLSLGVWLASLRYGLRLQPLLLEALAEKAIRQAAAEANLSVSTEELQQAANRFHQKHRFRTAQDTHAWLQQNSLRVIDFEAMLEQTLLAEKFRSHLAERQTEERLAGEPDRYARARSANARSPLKGWPENCSLGSRMGGPTSPN